MNMKSTSLIVLLACVFCLVGCQTRITAEKRAEQVLPIEKVVQVNGEDRVVVDRYQIASGGWYATARSPLYADETLDGLDIEVKTNGTVKLTLAKYDRDTSSNATEMVKGMFSGGAQVAKEIGEAYVKIAGGGAQASTVMSIVGKAINAFKKSGGDISKAVVETSSEAAKFTICDGSKCVECDASGNCRECPNGKCSE